MKLSSRLLALSGEVTAGKGLADIGTDHGKLPVYLVLNGIIPYAIASDSRIESLKKAEKLVDAYGLNDKIEIRLGNGLDVLNPGETPQMVVAGMGGPLIAEILSKGINTARSAEKLILQPMQYPEYLSRWLYHNHFVIKNEELVEDGGKIYRIFVCCSGVPKPVNDDIFYEIGEKLIEKKQPLLGKYISQSIERYMYIYQNLSGIDEKIKIKDKVNRLEGILNECKGTDNI